MTADELLEFLAGHSRAEALALAAAACIVLTAWCWVIAAVVRGDLR